MIKFLLVATTLALAPMAAGATCYGDHQNAASCAEGMTWDAKKGACVEQVSS